jgi:predicted CopG family antitoxin
LIRKKNIAISEPNYVALKKLGCVGDSFDDVVSEILHQMPRNETKIPTIEYDDIITSRVRDSEGEPERE